MIIRAIPQRPDWFYVNLDLVSRLGAAPKVQWQGGRWEAHRSLLGLLRDVPEVQRLLDAGGKADITQRDERDRLTTPLGFKLRPYQHVGVEFIQQRRGVLVADSLRTGKTVTALMTHDPSKGSLLVFCPKIVREVWIEWIQRRYPGVSPENDIAVLQGQTFDPKLMQRPFIVGHYDILKHWQADQKIGTLIFDEAHVLSKKTSQRSRAANFLAARAQRVLCLTGTPLWNKPVGLWSILNLLAQGSWGSYHEFARRYCDPEPTAHGVKYRGSSNEDELKARLAQIMIRRTWQEVSRDVPPITRDVLIADLDHGQRREVDILVEELRTVGTRATAAGELARYRRVLGTIKVDATIEAATSVLERGEPVVVWVWHRDTGETLAKALARFGAYLITGDVSDKKREKALRDWRSSNGALIMSISVGTAGIDLSHARLAIFCEIDFTPALIAQAEMRTFSPLRPMHISYVVADHVVDRKLIFALQEKVALSGRVAVPAAEAVMDILSSAFDVKLGEGDLNRLMADLLASEYE